MKPIRTKGFQFKQFSIHDGCSGMPVSTDGVILGAWTRVSGQRVLDIGTGTGLLSLMLAQRYDNIDITAVDIDSNAYQDACHNVAQSPWSGRIKVVQDDILILSGTASFDTIICNPPYFNSGEQARISSRAVARHTSMLTHPDLLSCCQQLLTENGKASFVLPIVEGLEFVELAKKNKWFISRLCKVQTTSSKGCSRLLIELSRQVTCYEESILTIHAPSGQYSQDFIALTQDFYLKM